MSRRDSTNAATLRLTTGAMIAAVFAVFLFLNRQTGELFSEVFTYILPIPMAAYAAKFGLKSSFPVLAVMVILSFLFGTPTTIFYALAAAVTGMVFGACLYRHVDMTRTMFIVMGLSALSSVLSMVALASLIGYDLNMQAKEMSDIMTGVFTKVGQEIPPALLSPDFLKRTIVVALVFVGLLQGFIIFRITIWILKRLRYHIPEARPVVEMAPPKWTGFAALLASFGYSASVVGNIQDIRLKNALETLGIAGYYFLLTFGVIAVSLLVRKYVTRNKVLGVILTVLAIMTLPSAVMVLGVFYLSLGLREHLAGAGGKAAGAGKAGNAAAGSAGTAAAGKTGAAGAGNTRGRAQGAGQRRLGIAERARLTERLRDAEEAGDGADGGE